MGGLGLGGGLEWWSGGGFEANLSHFHTISEFVLDVPRKLPLKFHQNRDSNS